MVAGSSFFNRISLIITNYLRERNGVFYSFITILFLNLPFPLTLQYNSGVAAAATTKIENEETKMNYHYDSELVG